LLLNKGYINCPICRFNQERYLRVVAEQCGHGKMRQIRQLKKGGPFLNKKKSNRFILTLSTQCTTFNI